MNSISAVHFQNNILFVTYVCALHTDLHPTGNLNAARGPRVGVCIFDRRMDYEKIESLCRQDLGEQV